MLLGSLVLLMAEIGIGALVYQKVEGIAVHFHGALEASLNETAKLASSLLLTDIRDGALDTGKLESALANFQKQDRIPYFKEPVRTFVALRIFITDLKGRVIYDSTGINQGRDFSITPDVRLAMQGEYASREVSQGGSTVLYVSLPIVWQDRTLGVVSVGRSTMTIEPLIRAAQRNFVVVGMGSGLAVALLVLAALIFLMKPIQLWRDYLHLFQNRTLPARPHLRRTRLGQFGAAIDHIFEALAGRSYVQNYVQTLTHELKSPLSAIKAGAELLEAPMPDGQHLRFVTDIREQADRIQVIVERLLALAALEQRDSLSQQTRIDLSGLVQEAIASLSMAANARQIQIQSRIPKGLTISGERFLLIHALTNLLSNAIEFSPVHSEIEITVHKGPDAYEISIKDHGVGIPDYASHRIFERFYSLPRPDSDHKGTGLGLSFVQEVAELHGGEVTLSNHPEGGTLAVLRLPRG
jgi:two-component system sensor histidine kinase CreC